MFKHWRSIHNVENVENSVDKRNNAEKFLTLLLGKHFYSFPDGYFRKVSLYEKLISGNNSKKSKDRHFYDNSVYERRNKNG